MKKYMIEEFTKDIYNREWHSVYECESYEHITTKDVYGHVIRAIRLDNVTNGKGKQLTKGKIINIEVANIVTNLTVYVWENGTDNIIEMFEDR